MAAAAGAAKPNIRCNKIANGSSLWLERRRRVMERKRWETAVRCLEIAIHPNTSDEEAIAAIRGFRRTAGGAPLDGLLRGLASTGADGIGHLHARLDQLHQENRWLQLKLAETRASGAAAQRELAAAQHRAAVLREELAEAEHHASVAERRLAEFQGAYGRISGGLQSENRDLRRALQEARRDLAQPIHEPIAPFQSMLNTALQRGNAPSPPTPAPLPSPAPSWTA